MKEDMKYYILSIILLFFSCSEVCDSDVYEIKIPKGTDQKELLLSSFVENIKIVSLETKDECLISQIDKIRIFKDEIYILDKMNNAVFIYGIDGKHHRTLFKVGNGPGEYLQLMDFDIWGNQLFVLDFGGRNILKYDCNLNYINKIKNPNFSTQILVNNGFIYLYNLKSKKGDDYKCTILNISGQKKSDKLLRKDNENLFNHNECNVFAVNNGEVFISPVYDRLIYKDVNFDSFCRIRFEGKEFPDDRNIEEQNVNDQEFDYIVKNNYYVFDRYFIFDYLVQDQRVFCVLDRSNNQLNAGVVKNDLIQDYRFFPRWGDKNYLVEEINAGILCEYFPDFLKSMDLEKLSFNDNPVILIYEIKK